MDKRINLSGTIMGVAFTVAMTEGPNETLIVEGHTTDPAGALPIRLNLSLDEERHNFSATGTLLGSPFSITAEVPGSEHDG